MKTSHTIFSSSAAAAVCAAMALGVPAESQAAVTAYLFSSWTSPANVTNAPFTFTGATGYQLTLNGSGVATGYAAIPAGFSGTIDQAVSFSSIATASVNAGEANGTTAAHINAEVQTWDDAGIIDEGPTDALLNVDYNNLNAAVAFKTPTPGFTRLIVAEDAGLDPFRLSVGATTVFNGFSESTKNSLLALNNFSGADTDLPGNMDQVFLFIWDTTQTGLATITDNGNYGGERLEVDFVGTNVVPIPAALPLLGSALAGLGIFGRRRRPAAAA